MNHGNALESYLKAFSWLLAVAAMMSCSDVRAQNRYTLALERGETYASSEEVDLSTGSRSPALNNRVIRDVDQIPSELQKKISLRLADATVEEAIQRIADESDLRFVYGQRKIAGEKRVTLRMHDQPAIDVLRETLLGTNLEMMLSTTGQLIVVDRATRPVVAERNPVSVVTRSTVRRKLQGSITGTVTDAESGVTIPGANVSIEGTQQGASTDAAGLYTIESVEPGTYTVQASFVGYATATVDDVQVVDGEAVVVDFALQPTDIGLDEVVVTALGIDREARALGYSVARVTPEDLTVNRTPNFMDALQGKMPGVHVSPMGTGPQGSSKVRIRGQSSFGANNSPLIVVDGVPIDNTTFGVSGDLSERGANRNSDSGDGLSSINPDNIEDMTILKGAAASALYGARAKDGVIMITTKNRARGTGIQLEYTSSFTTETPLDYRDYQMEYGQGEGGVRPTSSFPVSGVWSFGEKFEPGMTHVLFDGLEVPYEPQPNQLHEYYQSGHNLSNSLTISSGSENGGFSISLSNLNSQAILPGSGYRRNNVGLGFTQRVADRLTLSGNVHYSNENRENPPNIAEQDYSPVTIYTLATSMPMDVLEENCCDEEGNEIIFSRFTNRTNPYFALERFENNERDRVYGNITARIDFTNWLYLQGRIGQDYYHRDQEYNLPTGSQRQAPAPPGFVNGQYIRDGLNFRERNIDFLVGANQRFGDFGIDVNFGGNQMYRSVERNNVLVSDFFSRGLYAVGNGRSVSPDHDLSERQVNSLYGIAELSYRELLYLTGTLRNDWFSTLSPEERSILYPSITASFVFTDAMGSAVPSWLSDGRFRAAYAQVGSDTDVSPYSNNLFYNINTNFFNESPLGSISGASVPNPFLRPMRVTEWEVGLDVTLANNLRIDFAYYDKTSTDQILNQQISNASGFSSRSINVGESKNQGLEMLVSFSPMRTANMSWRTSFNASYNTTEVVDLGDDVGIHEITVGNADFHGELRQVTGMPMNQLYGWGYLRDEQGRQIYNAETGRPERSIEMLAFGSSIPTWIGGITNSFALGDLSLTFLIDFSLGHKMISGTHTNAYRHGLDKATLVGREEGYVIGDGVNPDGSVNTTRADVQTFYETIRAFQGSEQSVFDAGSWQLRQISLGYDFTRLLGGRTSIRGVRLNAVARNVAVLKKWVPHIHPDQNGIISDRRQGLEATGLPVTRSLGLTLNVQF